MTVTNKGSMYIKVPHAYVLFGGTDDVDYIQLSEDIELAASTAFSVSCWLNWNVIENANFFSNDTSYADGRFQINGASTVSVWDGTSGHNLTLYNALTTNKWFHICITRSAAGAVNVYIDGVKGAATITGVTGDLLLRRIGCPPTDSSHLSWDGGIADIQIWTTTELTATEVEKVYNGIDVSPDHRFKLNEPYESTTIADSIDEDVTGTVNGNSVFTERSLRCWGTRWDEDNWGVTIETFMDPCDRNILCDNIVPGAVAEQYNILDTPHYVDMTYSSGNTLIIDPVGSTGLDSLRNERVIGVKSYTDTFLTKDYLSIKIEGKRLDI